MVNLLLACTGSVATIKAAELIQEFKNYFSDQNVTIEIRVILTSNAMNFFPEVDIPKEVKIYSDADEWEAWKKRGDPVVHIDLTKWADIFLIAPLSANTLAKIANGICDNLVTSTVRAWDMKKPLVYCPAMNTKMFTHPLTSTQFEILQNWGYKMIPVMEKTLICGDTGLGAMAELSTIVEFVKKLL